MKIPQVKASCNDCKKVGHPTEMMGSLTLTPPKSFLEDQAMALASGGLILRMGQHGLNAGDSTGNGPSHNQFTITDEADKTLCEVSAFEAEQDVAAWLNPFAADIKRDLRIEAEGHRTLPEHG